jgi:hypothetical protein
MPRPTRVEEPAPTTDPGAVPPFKPSHGRGAEVAAAPDLRVQTRDEVPTESQWPKLVGNAVFWFASHPERWFVNGGELDGGSPLPFAVLPGLSKLSATPGANGVSTVQGRDGMQSVRMVEAFAGAEQRGMTILPHDIDGPGTTYLRAYQVGEVQNRKTLRIYPVYHWVTRFETAFPRSEQIVSDQRGFTLWLRGLILAGRIPGPSVPVLERLRATTLQQLQQAQSAERRSGTDLERDVVGRLRGRVEEVEREIQRVLAAERNTPAVPASNLPDLVANLAPDLAGNFDRR